MYRLGWFVYAWFVWIAEVIGFHYHDHDHHSVSFIIIITVYSYQMAGMWLECPSTSTSVHLHLDLSSLIQSIYTMCNTSSSSHGPIRTVLSHQPLPWQRGANRISLADRVSSPRVVCLRNQLLRKSSIDPDHLSIYSVVYTEYSLPSSNLALAPCMYITGGDTT